MPERCVCVRSYLAATGADEKPSFPTSDGSSARMIAGVNDSTARGLYEWTPRSAAPPPHNWQRGRHPFTAAGVRLWRRAFVYGRCERLEDDFLYSFSGRHRLDVKGVCFSATDDGGWDAWSGKLTATAACVSIPILRCTKPTVKLHAASRAAANATAGRYVVPVATNISFFLNATDDVQTRALRIFHTADPGIPAFGATWEPAGCAVNASQQLTCSPTHREFSFASQLVHAGTAPRVCFEATNDQVECPPYRRNAGAQPYGTHLGGAVAVSRASEPLCVTLEVPGPDIRWRDPSPAEGTVILTYMGCPLELTLFAEDHKNYFDIAIEPWTAEYAMPAGVLLGSDVCKFRDGLPSPAVVSDGVGTCPSVSRRLNWTPQRDQTGLLKRVCIDAVSKAARTATRCFTLHVSKCRYCAQPGETMQSLADSFQTDWLQLWGANAHGAPNPAPPRPRLFPRARRATAREAFWKGCVSGGVVP